LVARILIASLALEVAGCGSSRLAPALIRARSGPAAAQPIRRVVALGATCGSLDLHVVEPSSPSARPSPTSSSSPLEVLECGRDALAAADQAIRSALDFAGYGVIDAERVNAVAGRRREIEERHGILASRTTWTTGATFADATPAEQADILKALGAEGVLTTRVWIGAGTGFSARRSVSVQLRLATATDRTLVWARRCEIEVGIEQDPSAMQRAARCAAEGARPR